MLHCHFIVTYIIAMILSHPLGFAKQLAAGRSGCLGS